MAALALLQHYFEYLRSPPVLLTILIIVGPILLEVYKNKILPRGPERTKIPGCFRLGLTKRSNLHDQYDRDSSRKGAIGNASSSGSPRIKALFTYPIKSCRGVELAASEIVPTGLKYDRLFTFAQLVSTQDKAKSSDKDSVAEVSDDWKHEWRFITQREFPRLALLETELWAPDPRAKKSGEANGQVGANGKKTSKRGASSRETQNNSSQRELSAEAEATDTADQHPQGSWAENGGCLIIRFPYEPDFNPLGFRTEPISIYLPLIPTSQRAQSKQYTYGTLSIWKDFPTAINLTNDIWPDDLAKLKYFLGVSNPLALFRVDDRNKRAVSRSLPKDRPDQAYSVGFADAFPLHILSIASAQALDEELPQKAAGLKGKLDARRFRANIYITGAPAYEEDNWKRITVGRCIKHQSKSGKVTETDGEYHVACRTARCKLPNVDPDTGVKDANEPDTTLRRTRQVDKGAFPHPCLGMQMIPLFQQGILRVGDEVKVLERGEHVYEKMFS